MAGAVRMSLRDKMFSFKGRLRRADYWGISIFLGLIVFVITETVMLYGFGPEFSLLTGGLDAGEMRAFEGWPYAVQMLISLATFWPSLAMSAKRAHDRDKSARFIIGLLIVFEAYIFAQPLMIGWLTYLATTPLGMLAYLGLTLLALAGAIYVFVTVGCLDGTPGPNRFGPSPKVHELAEAA